MKTYNNPTEDLHPYFHANWGKQEPLPNFKEIPAESASYTIIHGRFFANSVGAKLPGSYAHNPLYCAVFLTVHQSGWKGEGTVLWQNSYNSPLRAATFALCEHKFVEGGGANHQRGWHPGSCSLCGCDLSVDSGD